jgi:hypothetical protein
MNGSPHDFHTTYSNLRMTHRLLKRQLKSRRAHRLLYDSNMHLHEFSSRTSSIFRQIAKYDAIELPSNALDTNFAIGIPHVTKAFFYRDYLFE